MVRRAEADLHRYTSATPAPMLPSPRLNPFVARFTPPTSSRVVTQAETNCKTSSSVDQPSLPVGFREQNHAFPLSPIDTISPSISASLGHISSESVPLSLDDAAGPVCSSVPEAPEKADARYDRTSGAVPLSKGALLGLERSQNISPEMLARDHLPRIMLDNGPMALRHILACLNQTIPGFARISPPKAHKLVVSALMCRGIVSHDGPVEFRKLGKGRFDTRRVGRPIEHLRHTPEYSDPDSCAMSHQATALSTSPAQALRDGRVPQVSPSLVSLDEVLDMSMDEDGDSSVLSSGAETEDEDWFSMGPEGLQTATPMSMTGSSARINYNLKAIPGAVYNRRFSTNSRARRPSQLALVTTMSAQQALPGTERAVAAHELRSAHSPQEHDAIDALIKMGSM